MRSSNQACLPVAAVVAVQSTHVSFTPCRSVLTTCERISPFTAPKHLSEMDHTSPRLLSSQKIFSPPLPPPSHQLALPQTASNPTIRQQLPCGTSFDLFIYTLVYIYIVLHSRIEASHVPTRHPRCFIL